MRHIVLVAALAAAGLAGCATGGDPASVAARECGYFARMEGANLLGVDGVDPVSEGDANYKVRMRVEDALSRRMNAACLYSSASNKARWASPLPSGFARI
jgi:hypothetical protein